MPEKHLVAFEMLRAWLPFAYDTMCWWWKALSMLAPNCAEGRKSLGCHYAVRLKSGIWLRWGDAEAEEGLWTGEKVERRANHSSHKWDKLKGDWMTSQRCCNKAPQIADICCVTGLEGRVRGQGVGRDTRSLWIATLRRILPCLFSFWLCL